MKILGVVERDKFSLEEVYEQRSSEFVAIKSANNAREYAKQMGYIDWQNVTGALVYEDGNVLPPEVWISKNNNPFWSHAVYVRIVQVDLTGGILERVEDAISDIQQCAYDQRDLLSLLTDIRAILEFDNN